MRLVALVIGFLIGASAQYQFASRSEAAEFVCTTWTKVEPRECVVLFIRGEIVEGDAATFQSWIKDNPEIFIILLNSPGGSLREGIKIGRLVRANLLQTEAPRRVRNQLLMTAPNQDNNLCPQDDCACVSACFLVWAAGVGRLGSELGLHRPRSTSKDFWAAPPSAASRLYGILLDETVRYLREMEVPTAIVEAMLQTPSADVRWLKLEEVDTMFGSPWYDEWIAAACGTMSDSEGRRLLELRRLIQSQSPSVSAADRQTFERLHNRRYQIVMCEHEKALAVRRKNSLER
jgi:hypothetical protein